MTFKPDKVRPSRWCHFYLFDQSFVFFRYWRVDARIEIKMGPVQYRGPFSVARRPAHWVSFADTSGLVVAIEEAFAAPLETIRIDGYQRLMKDGDPVVGELKLRNWTELGRTAFLFNVEDYGKWLRVTRWPWRQGAFQGWPCWERVVRAIPSRERALERLALSVQTQFPPRGFEFKPKRGLVAEPRRAPWPRKATTLKVRVGRNRS
jgi:hypothetical protein